MHFYLQNIKDENIRFEVIEFDKETKVGKLRGEYGAVISRDISKESLTKLGYRFVKSEKPLPLSSAPKKPAAPKEEEE
jgi:hypothetical protein